MSLIYATCFVAIKAGLPYAPPLRFAGLRLLIAGIALLGLALARREPLLPPRHTWWRLLGLTLTGSTMAYGAMFLSPGLTGAGIASVLGNTQPLLAVVLARIFLGERITRGKLTSLVLGMAGIGLIAYPAIETVDAGASAGSVFALASAAGAVSSSIIIKRLGPIPSLLAFTAWSLVLGSLPLLVGSPLIESGDRVVWNPAFIGLLLFLALLGTSLATVVWYWLVQRNGVGSLTLYLLLVPVLGMVMAAALFAERIVLIEGFGIGLTLAGIGMVVRETQRTTPADRPPEHGEAGEAVLQSQCRNSGPSASHREPAPRTKQ